MIPERIAVDATALISASLKGRALKLFLQTPVKEFLTTSFNFEEARSQLPAVCKALPHIPLLEAETILNTLPLILLDRQHYQTKLLEAEELIRRKDQKDVDLLALALFEEIPIWSDDSDFKIPQVWKEVKCYTTYQLFRLLELKYS